MSQYEERAVYQTFRAELLCIHNNFAYCSAAVKLKWNSTLIQQHSSGKKLTLSQELSYPSTLSIYKRIANLGLAVAALIVVLNLLLNNMQKEQALLQQQADLLGHSLLGQAGILLQQQLSPINKKAIEQILDSLEQDPHIQSVALFKNNGELLAASHQHLSLVGHYNQTARDDLLVYMYTIKQDFEIKGFVRLLLHKDQVLAVSKAFQQQQQQQIPLMVALAILMGVLTTRAFYKLKYRRYSVKKEYHS